MNVYSSFWSSGKTTETFRALTSSIEADINSELLEKLKKIQKRSPQNQRSTILNPFDNILLFKKLTPAWKELFLQHRLFDNEKDTKELLQSLATACEDRSRPPFHSEALPFLEFIKGGGIDEDDIESFKDSIGQFSVIRPYNAKLEDANSFYRAVGFAYIENLLWDEKPFDALLKFLKGLKAKGSFEMMSPVSNNVSMNVNVNLNFKCWSSYLIDQFMRMAGEMWASEELNNRNNEKLAEQWRNLFNNNLAIQMGVVILLRQLAYEKVKANEGYKHTCQNLTDIDAMPEVRNFKTIAKIVKMKLLIVDLDEPSDEDFVYPKDSEGNKISLIKYKNVFHVVYSKSYSKLRFPKLLQLNREIKNKLCCQCGLVEGKHYNECTDYFCYGCLNKLLNEVEGNVVKCPRCESTLGTKGHLLSVSQIKGKKIESD